MELGTKAKIKNHFGNLPGLKMSHKPSKIMTHLAAIVSEAGKTNDIHSCSVPLIIV